MRTSLAGAAVLAAVALSACGGSGGGGTTTQGSQPAASTQSQAATTGTATATATATQTATGATTAATGAATGTATADSGGAAVGGGGSSDQCTAADLALSYLGGQGATGHGELGFALKNIGSSACSTGGYPGIQFLDANGSPLPTTPQHTTDDFVGHTTLQQITLQPGQTASFRLGVSHGGGSSAGCSTAAALQVIAPNDTATMKVTIPNGASECGTTTVSPMQPGTSAYQ